MKLFSQVINLDMNKNQSNKKIRSLCLQCNLFQIIHSPTHFTESSSSLIDLFLVSSPASFIIKGVGEPFLDQNTRYHCPILCCMNMAKPKYETFKRKIWKLENGDYDGMRDEASSFDWKTLLDNDIDKYAENVSHKIMFLSEKYIQIK